VRQLNWKFGMGHWWGLLLVLGLWFCATDVKPLPVAVPTCPRRKRNACHWQTVSHSCLLLRVGVSVSIASTQLWKTTESFSSRPVIPLQWCLRFTIGSPRTTGLFSSALLHLHKSVGGVFRQSAPAGRTGQKRGACWRWHGLFSAAIGSPDYLVRLPEGDCGSRASLAG